MHVGKFKCLSPTVAIQLCATARLNKAWVMEVDEQLMNMGHGNFSVCLHGRLTVVDFATDVGFSSDTHSKTRMGHFFLAAIWVQFSMTNHVWVGILFNFFQSQVHLSPSLKA